jgi:hypothetical protein
MLQCELSSSSRKGTMVAWLVGWLSNEKENENLQFKQQEETILSMILLTLIDSSSCLRMNLSKLFFIVLDGRIANRISHCLSKLFTLLGT